MQTAADLFSQLTGTGASPANALASYAITAVFWAVLFTLAKSATDRQRDPMAGLLASGFAVLLAGSVFMAGIAVLDAYSIFSLTKLQAIYPPVQLALSNLGLAIVAGALAGRLTGNLAGGGGLQGQLHRRGLVSMQLSQSGGLSTAGATLGQRSAKRGSLGCSP